MRNARCWDLEEVEPIRARIPDRSVTARQPYGAVTGHSDISHSRGRCLSSAAIFIIPEGAVETNRPNGVVRSYGELLARQPVWPRLLYAEGGRLALACRR